MLREARQPATSRTPEAQTVLHGPFLFLFNLKSKMYTYYCLEMQLHFFRNSLCAPRRVCVIPSPPLPQMLLPTHRTLGDRRQAWRSGPAPSTRTVLPHHPEVAASPTAGTRHQPYFTCETGTELLVQEAGLVSCYAQNSTQ